jgi:hypothetical protein
MVIENNTKTYIKNIGTRVDAMEIMGSSALFVLAQIISLFDPIVLFRLVLVPVVGDSSHQRDIGWITKTCSKIQAMKTLSGAWLTIYTFGTMAHSCNFCTTPLTTPLHLGVTRFSFGLMCPSHLPAAFRSPIHSRSECCVLACSIVP